MRGLQVFTNIPNPYNRHLYAALRELGVDLRVVFRGEPEGEGRSWEIQPSPPDVVAATLRSVIATARHARASGDAVILTGSYTRPLDAIRRAVLAGTSAPVLAWGERLKPARLPLKLYRRAYFARGGLDAILAVGTFAAPSYQAIVGDFIPVHVFPYTTAVPSARRSPADRPLVGFAGSLIRRKGLDVLLDALGSLTARSRPVLEVAGAGPERPALEQQASALGVQVEWLGEQSPEALEEIRARWWVQAVPSRYDGWGVVVSEAMAASVPVIATPCTGAARDLIRPGFNGGIAAGVESWASLLVRHLDPELVATESEAARIVGEETSSQKAAEWLVDLLGDGPPAPEPRSFVATAWSRVLERARNLPPARGD